MTSDRTRTEPADQLTFGTEPFYAAIGRAFITMCAAIPLLWLIEAVDYLAGHSIDAQGGIHPRHVDGLDGIVLAPFLHASLAHLASNSVPLVLLGTFVLAGQPRRFLVVTVFVALISGITVWLFGDPNSIVVGASGVIFGYLGYLFLHGIVDRRLWSLAAAVLAALLFGWQIIGVLPGDPQVSWQGHLGGLVAGLVAAVVFRRRKPRAAALDGPPNLTLPPLT